MNQRVLPTWSARDGILLELNLAGQPTPESEGRVESRIGLTVTDMDAVIADLRDRGVKIAREPYGARTFRGPPGQHRGPFPATAS